MAFTHRFDPTTLREYDIRGTVGRTLFEDDAFAIGRCFGSIVARNGGRTVAVGYDGRLSSPALEAALAKGLSASGIEAIRIGRGPTPMLYYAVDQAGDRWRGDGDRQPQSARLQRLQDGARRQAVLRRADHARWAGMAQAGDVVEETVTPERNIDIAADYIARVLADWDGGDRMLKVVWDNGNGAAGDVLQRLVAGLPGEHIVLNGAIDGTFPAHHPDPTVPANLQQLIAEVAAHHADIGIALDGDADRIGLIDDKGRILFGDQLLVLLARDVLREHPGATIIADVKASQVLFDEVARAGGNPLMWRTGHSLIKAKMAETGSPLAGEMSGHIFFADRWYGFDDALYAAVRTLGVLARMDGKLSDGARCAAAGDQHARGALRLRRHAQVRGDRGGRGSAARRWCAKVAETDGVRVLTDDGWWLLRASNTQAVLVARAEAATEAGLERLKQALVHQLELSGLPPPDFSGSHAGH